MNRKTFLRLSAISAAMACIGPVHAATAFETTAKVGTRTLVLNGSGTRFKAVFQVYDMAMYLVARVSNADAALAMEGPKRIAFVAQRSINPTDLGLAFMRGFRDNNDRHRVNAHLMSVSRMVEVFSARRRLDAGNTFSMEFEPNRGTTFFVEGQPQGEPVGDAEFFRMVMRIWLGPAPADWLLKDALLGIERKKP